MIMVTHLISHHKLSVTHSIERPLSHNWCLSVTLSITLGPPGPVGHCHRAAALCQACFLLLCSESSAPACSFKDFLLSGPVQACSSLGYTIQSPGVGQQGPWPPLPPADPCGTQGIFHYLPFDPPGSLQVPRLMLVSLGWAKEGDLWALPSSQGAQACASQEGSSWAPDQKLPTLPEQL